MSNIVPSIFYCDITDIGIDPNILSLLPRERQERIQTSVRYMKAKQLYVSSLLLHFILMKHGINNPEIKISDNGKPYIDSQLRFNLSHSGNYVVLAIDPYHPIGIDIQENRPFPNHTDKFFIGETTAEIPSFAMRFPNAYIWCRKEALLKCLGVGWNGLEEQSLPVLNDITVYKQTKYYFTDYIISENYFTTLCEKYTHKKFKVQEVAYHELALFYSTGT